MTFRDVKNTKKRPTYTQGQISDYSVGGKCLLGTPYLTENASTFAGFQLEVHSTVHAELQKIRDQAPRRLTGPYCRHDNVNFGERILAQGRLR